MTERVFSAEKIGYAQFVTWSLLTTGDTGSPWELLSAADKTVQIFGDFGAGATVTLQGSNDPRVLTAPSSAVWFSLTDPQANAIEKTAAAGEAILENPRWIRPSVTGGTNPDLTVIISAVRSS